jgi:surface polysaccharide O-acyltransferase-like enzyme
VSDAGAGTAAALPSRKAPIDVMRAVSMLYIVGFWHLLDYTKVATWHYNPVTYRLTVGALALFVLISGFLTGRTDGPLARGEIWRFYRTRFWSIYLPFLIASGLFLATGVSDALSLFKGVTLVGMLLAPPPFTLWFVNMIVLFYLIAPLLIGLRGNKVAYIALCTVIVGAMILYQAATGRLDMRLILYFPCFAAGIFLAAGSLPSSTLSLIGLLVLAALSLVPTLTSPSWSLEGDPWAMPWALFGSIAVFVVVMRVARNLKSPALLTQFSEASFFMYLLHRPLYLWMLAVWFPSTEKAEVLYLSLVCLPIIGIVAWLCQRAYTGFLQWREAPNPNAVDVGN